MERPLNLIARGVELPPELAQEIHERAARLERFYPRLVGCSVVVEGPGRHHRRGGPYDVRLDLRVPGAEPILVNRQHQEGLARAIDDVFDVATRRLEDLQRLQRAEVKRHEEPQQRARVARLLPERDCGFLITADGREIYFHRHSVLGDFDALAPGSEVRFHETSGDEGPQASTVIVL
jgi:ribosome-associated translation inhibitor RaiA